MRNTGDRTTILIFQPLAFLNQEVLIIRAARPFSRPAEQPPLSLNVGLPAEVEKLTVPP